ncbi:MAG: MFS transporter [Myxococcota bacterium]|nr:MFS transporter [Myxococcota bacterium]
MTAPASYNASASETRYANYVLVILTMMYTFNYLDRWVLSILVEDIKADFGVSDTYMGFLLGPVFAIFYTVLGLPIARLADRSSRRNILSIAFVAWSAMTALSGLARNGIDLALARVGVGVGEAGGTAPAHSLLADYFPPERRAFAFGVFQQGVFLGQFFGLTLGAWISTTFSWQQTFIAFGVAGLFGAALLFATVREPIRGRYDPAPPESANTRPSIKEVFALLWGKKSFRALAIGGGIASFGGTGFGTWMPALLERALEMPRIEIGTRYGMTMAIFGGLGALLGGYLTDRLSRRDVRWLLWMPAASVILSLPLLMAQVFAPSANFAVAMAIPSGLLGGGWAPAAYAGVQRLAPAHMRAVAASIMVLFITLLGQGAGPQAIGILSDLFEAEHGLNSIRIAIAVVLSSYSLAFVALVIGARHLRNELDSG